MEVSPDRGCGTIDRTPYAPLPERVASRAWEIRGGVALGQEHLPSRSLTQSVGEQVRGCDCVLDRQIDSHSSRRRHRMSGVSDAQQARQVPLPQTIQLHREQVLI